MLTATAVDVGAPGVDDRRRRPPRRARRLRGSAASNCSADAHGNDLDPARRSSVRADTCAARQRLRRRQPLHGRRLRRRGAPARRSRQGFDGVACVLCGRGLVRARVAEHAAEKGPQALDHACRLVTACRRCASPARVRRLGPRAITLFTRAQGADAGRRTAHAGRGHLRLRRRQCPRRRAQPRRSAGATSRASAVRSGAPGRWGA